MLDKFYSFLVYYVALRAIRSLLKREVVMRKVKRNVLIDELRSFLELSDKDALERLGFISDGQPIAASLLDELHDFEKAAGRLLLSRDVDLLNRRFG